MTVSSQSHRPHAPEFVLNAVSRLTPKVLPGLPLPVKFLMAGGRAKVIDGNTLDPTLAAFTAGLRLMGIRGLNTDDDVYLDRRLMLSLCRSLGGERAVVDVTELSIPGPAGPLKARHYRPPGGPEPAPALVFFHGGGYLLGDLDTHDAACRLICRDAGTHVFSIEYRLAPEHPAPAGVDDCLAAFRWVAAHTEELGVLADRVAVGGDSAGGGLAAVVSQLARDGGPAPCLQLLVYPVVDLRAQTRSRTLFASGLVLTADDLTWFADRYLEGSTVSDDDPRVSPARAADLSGLPPALVITAGFDPLRDEGAAYAAALSAAGVPVDLREMGSMTHGFLNFDALGGGVRACIDELTSALRAHLQRA